MKKFRPKIFYITIRDTEWRYRLIPRKLFNKIHPKHTDAGGLTVPESKRIDFTLDSISKRYYPLHELGHAYRDTTDTDEMAEVTPDDVEELMCTIYPRYWTVISRQATEILKNLKPEAKRLRKFIAAQRQSA